MEMSGQLHTPATLPARKPLQQLYRRLCGQKLDLAFHWLCVLFTALKMEPEIQRT
jgi:hypothetical protein